MNDKKVKLIALGLFLGFATTAIADPPVPLGDGGVYCDPPCDTLACDVVGV